MATVSAMAGPLSAALNPPLSESESERVWAIAAASTEFQCSLPSALRNALNLLECLHHPRFPFLVERILRWRCELDAAPRLFLSFALAVRSLVLLGGLNKLDI